MQSEVFATMLEFKEGEEGQATEPIELQDDEADFEAFWDTILSCVRPPIPVLFTSSFDTCAPFPRPYESCLEQESPDLEKVLGVFTIANKYCATAIEKRARAITIQLTRSQTIRSHLTERLTPLRVVEISNLVGCEEAFEAAWKAAQEDFHSSLEARPPQSPISIPQIIDFAEKIGRDEMLGDVYYMTLLCGPAVWTNPKLGLKDRQVQTLWCGMAQYAEASEKLFRRWRQGEFSGHVCGLAEPLYNAEGENIGATCGYRSFATRLAKVCDARRIPSYDILKRMVAAANLPKPDQGPDRKYMACHTEVIQGIIRDIREELKHLWRRFHVEDVDPILAEPDGTNAHEG